MARATGRTDRIADVREATFDFRDQVQAAFLGAGSGASFDATVVPEGLRQALVAYTDALRALSDAALDPGEQVDLTA